jgi:hypothetical protein
MRAFDYNSFIDLTQVFDFRKGQVALPKPVEMPAMQVVAQPMARVTLFSTTSLKAQLAQSRIVSLSALLPTVTPRFVTASAKKIKPVVIEIAPAVVVPAVPVVAAEAPKARTTLKLKSKVELPVLQTLSRRSTAQDLAAAFKTEMAMMAKMEKKAVVEQSLGKLEDAFTKRRRHPLSDKPWSELLAEVEAPKQSKSNFDLATAFKAEMKAFMAEQERLGNAQYKSAPEQQNVSQTPIRRFAA